MTKFSLNLLISDKQAIQSILTFQSQLQDQQYTVSEVCLAIIDQLFHPSNPQKYLTTLFCDKQCSLQLNASENIIKDMASYIKCSKQQYKQLLTVAPQQKIQQNAQHPQTQEEQVNQQSTKQVAILNKQQEGKVVQKQNTISEKERQVIEEKNNIRTQDLAKKQQKNKAENPINNYKVYDHSLSTLNNSPTKQQETKPLRPHNLPPLTPNKPQESPQGSCCQMI